MLYLVMHTIKQKIFQTAIEVKYVSDDVGSNSGILKILSEFLAPYAEGLCSLLLVYWQESSPQDVNDKIGTDNCTW